MSLLEAGKVAPGAVDPDVAARALRRIKDCLNEQGDRDEFAITVCRDSELFAVPRPAFEMLAYALAAMANGQGVQIVPINAELTTQQAADFLNVSRLYLIGLLDDGEIPYRLVGRHRRVKLDVLMEYRRQDDLKRKALVDELTRLDQELGGD